MIKGSNSLLKLHKKIQSNSSIQCIFIFLIKNFKFLCIINHEEFSRFLKDGLMEHRLNCEEVLSYSILGLACCIVFNQKYTHFKCRFIWTDLNAFENELVTLAKGVRQEKKTHSTSTLFTFFLKSLKGIKYKLFLLYKHQLFPLKLNLSF